MPQNRNAQTLNRDAHQQTQVEYFPDQAYPDGHLRHINPTRSERLQQVAMWELGSEFLVRIQEDGFEENESMVWLGSKLLSVLEQSLDIHTNRFSRQRYRDLFSIFHTHVVPKPVIQDATYVDLGCGSLNPLSMLFLFLMLGAKRGIAVDLDEMQDARRAAKALADLAGLMLLDPQSVVDEYSITREKILENIASCDLGKLREGNLSGIDTDRLVFKNESLYELSLTDNEADMVFSNAFLEHIPDMERGVVEMARITRVGGLNVHNIDTLDHRRYVDGRHPLDFLTIESEEQIVHQCNRLRLFQFRELFERNGFEVMDIQVYNSIEVPDELRATFAEPFRSMRTEDLEPLQARLIARRR